MKVSDKEGDKEAKHSPFVTCVCVYVCVVCMWYLVYGTCTTHTHTAEWDCGHWSALAGGNVCFSVCALFVSVCVCVCVCVREIAI